MSPDALLRLPPAAAAAAFLILTSMADSVQGHALPRQTSSLPQARTIDVVPWPLPTAAPIDPLAPRDQSPAEDAFLASQLLLPRQANTVCGFIGGNPELPATCSAGSHCVANVPNNVIGCCPDVGPCTTGIFTGCVDDTNGQQASKDPFVFTCSGAEVCFRNQFAGGFVQFGCGTTTGLDATVVASASGGGAAIALPSVSVTITGSETSTSESRTSSSSSSTSTSTSATRTRKSRTSSSTDSSSSAESTTDTATDTASSTEPTATASGTESSTTAASTTSPSANESGNAQADDQGNDDNGGGKKNVSAIVGGTIGGVAGLAALLALAFFLWRRNKGKEKPEGPGPSSQYAQYLSNPMVDTSQDPKPGSAATSRPRFSQGPLLAGGSISSRAGATDSRAAARSPEPYSGSAPYWTGSGGSAVGGYAPSESDDVPLTASDSRDYTMGSSPPRSSSEMSGSTGSGILSGMAGVGGSAVQGHNRQDSQPLPRISEDGSKYSSEYFSSDYTYGTYPGPRRGNSSGVLWQQNRDSQRSAGWL